MAPGFPKLIFHPDFILVQIQDDTEAASESQDMGSGDKPPGWTRIKRLFLISLSLTTLAVPGYYVVRYGGLFPVVLG